MDSPKSPTQDDFDDFISPVRSNDDDLDDYEEEERIPIVPRPPSILPAAAPEPSPAKKIGPVFKSLPVRAPEPELRDPVRQTDEVQQPRSHLFELCAAIFSIALVAVATIFAAHNYNQGKIRRYREAIQAHLNEQQFTKARVVCEQLVAASGAKLDEEQLTRIRGLEAEAKRNEQAAKYHQDAMAVTGVERHQLLVLAHELNPKSPEISAAFMESAYYLAESALAHSKIGYYRDLSKQSRIVAESLKDDPDFGAHGLFFDAMFDLLARFKPGIVITHLRPFDPTDVILKLRLAEKRANHSLKRLILTVKSMLLKDWSQVLRYSDRIRKTDPVFFKRNAAILRPLFIRGSYNSGRTEIALETLRQWRKAKPDDIGVLSLTLELNCIEGNFNEVARLAKTGVKLDPGLDLFVQLNKLLLIWKSSQEKGIAPTIPQLKALQNTLTQLNYNPELLTAAASFMIDVDLDLSLHVLKVVNFFAPWNVEAWYLRGKIEQLSENDGAAIVDYSEAIKLNKKHFKAYNNRSIIYRKIHKYHDAAIDSEKCLKLAPENAAVWFNHAKILWKAYASKRLRHADSGWDEVMRSLNKANTLRPNDPDILGRRGYLFQRRRQFSQARNDFDRAVNLSKDKTTYWIAVRGLLFEQLRKYESALSDYETVLNNPPPNQLVLVNRIKKNHDDLVRRLADRER